MLPMLVGRTLTIRFPFPHYHRVFPIGDVEKGIIKIADGLKALGGIMKNFIIAILSVVMVGIGAAEAAEKSGKGEWRVIKANCPHVLAEKDGQSKVFVFKTNTNADISSMHLYKKCKKVGSGWTITVEENGKYYFFPPTSNQRR